MTETVFIQRKIPWRKLGEGPSGTSIWALAIRSINRTKVMVMQRNFKEKNKRGCSGKQETSGDSTVLEESQLEKKRGVGGGSFKIQGWAFDGARPRCHG